MTDFLDGEAVDAWLEKRDRRRASVDRYQAMYPDRIKASLDKRRADPEWRAMRLARERKYRAGTPGLKEKLCAKVKEKYHALTPEEKKEFNRIKGEQKRAKDPDYSKRRWITHKESEYAKSARWRQRNPERMRVYEANRRAKAALNGGEFSPDIIERLMKAQKGKCNGCAVKLTKKNCCLDHIQPISRGGKSIDSNGQLLCRSCNSKKRDKDPIVFMQSRGFLL